MREDKFLRPRTIRDHIKAFLAALLLVLMPLLLLEGLLQIFDPWGIYFFDDMAMMANAFEPHEERLFYLPDGIYQFSRWTVSIENEARILPTPSADTDCRIVLLGDSVTFGYGVNDDEVWAYLLAQEFPNVEFINTGITAYNSYNVRQTHEVFPDADAYLYSVIYNDWEPNLNPSKFNDHSNNAASMPFIVRYGNFFLHHSSTSATREFTPEELSVHPRFERFYDDIEAIVADERVILLGFENSLTTLALIGGGYDLYQVEYPRYPISYADGHINAEGNAVLAERLKPIMQEIVDNYCP